MDHVRVFLLIVTDLLASMINTTKYSSTYIPKRAIIILFFTSSGSKFSCVDYEIVGVKIYLYSGQHRSKHTFARVCTS